MEQPRINLPKLCDTHRYLLVSQAGFARNDPWMALEVVTQVALFQAATADKKVWAKVAGDASKLSTLGCFACLKPDAFGEIVSAAQRAATKDAALGDIKMLGEAWAAPEPPTERGGA